MNEQDLSLFEEYFQLKHAIPVNIQPGGDWQSLPNFEQFENDIPTPYKIASEMKGLEQTMLRPLRQLGDVIEPLADYLKAQSRKIDLMMNYILQAQDEHDVKLNTTSFGGGGFTLFSEQVFTLDSWVKCKLFFNDDAAAVFCYAKVCKVETLDNGSNYTFVFHRIRDEDREIVVRASLHLQSKQLLKKTQEKSQ
ncbi:MAG: PilZ domain-containing protein [Gammaproteobacteria bacterium]|nr:PilZ domain-containing protein [Gammaproteobacteria bacterium]